MLKYVRELHLLKHPLPKQPPNQPTHILKSRNKKGAGYISHILTYYDMQTDETLKKTNNFATSLAPATALENRTA